MKKKIAGVLTTVLAASLFVGGNVPVTTQVGSMAAESQEDEDTQADEAEAESGEDTPVSYTHLTLPTKLEV